MSTAALPSATGQLITQVYTDKARYLPGNPVHLTVALANTTGAPWSGSLTLRVQHLERLADVVTRAGLTLPAGDSTQVTFTWVAPMQDFTGYQAVVVADPNPDGGLRAGADGPGANQASDLGGTGIDVSSSPLRFPRYGYVADYPQDQTAASSQAMVREMVEDYHLNLFQFYDWMWRHDSLVPRARSGQGEVTPQFQGLFGRRLSLDAVKADIAAMHAGGADALAYVMSYAAREGYGVFGVDSGWGIYTGSSPREQLSVKFGNGESLWLFNPADPGWQAFMLGQYRDAIKTAGFDGVHIDQMGQRDNVTDISGNPVDLPEAFPQYLNAIKRGLLASDPQHAAATFNLVDGTVNGWAVDQISRLDSLDFTFSEIWWKAKYYGNLRDYINQLRQNGKGKAVVLAAYMNLGDEVGPQFEAETATLSDPAGAAGAAGQANAVGAPPSGLRVAGQLGDVNALPGYTGDGYVDGFDSAGQAIAWSLDFPEAGDYSLVFRFANPGEKAASRTVYVDGKRAGQLFFNPGGDGTPWSTDAWLQVKGLAAGRHAVRLAYDADDTGAVAIDHLTLSQFSEPSVRLADAAMFASGATHIEIGDGSNMLAHEYYPNKSKRVTGSLKAAMRDDYSFAAAYENLLFERDVTPVEEAAQHWNVLSGQPTSDTGNGGSIWLLANHAPGYDVLHLINLVGNDEEWRNPADPPVVQEGIRLRYRVEGRAPVHGVYLASPDQDHGLSRPLAFVTGEDAQGRYIEFTVPRLEYWDMVYVKR